MKSVNTRKSDSGAVHPQLTLWVVVIAALFGINSAMLAAATTAALMHSLVVTNVQLFAAAAGVLFLLRSKGQNRSS